MTEVSKELWQPGHFADICTMDRKSIGSASGGDLPYLGLDLVESQTGEILGFSDEAPVGNSFLFGPQHVLYGKLRPYLNKVAVPDCSGKCSTELVPLLPRNGVDRDYLAHALRCQRVVNSVMEKNTGARMPRTDMKYLMSLPLLIPPLDEQRRIVDILKRADSIRRLRKQALETTRELIPALFVDMFGDPATNPKGWEIKKVADVADVQGGLQVTSKREAYSLEAPYLRVANVFRDRLNLVEIKTIRLTDSELRRTQLNEGDILVVEGHGNKDEIGRCAVWDGSIQGCVHQNHLIRIRPNPTLINSYFFSAYMNSDGGRIQLLRKGKTTSGLNTISTSNVKDCVVFAPPTERQQAFAKKLEEAKSIHAQQEYHLAQAEALRQSLMAQFFN